MFVSDLAFRTFFILFKCFVFFGPKTKHNGQCVFEHTYIYKSLFLYCFVSFEQKQTTFMLDRYLYIFPGIIYSMPKIDTTHQPLYTHVHDAFVLCVCSTTH